MNSPSLPNGSNLPSNISIQQISGFWNEGNTWKKKSGNTIRSSWRTNGCNGKSLSSEEERKLRNCKSGPNEQRTESVARIQDTWKFSVSGISVWQICQWYNDGQKKVFIRRQAVVTAQTLDTRTSDNQEYKISLDFTILQVEPTTKLK